MSGQFPADLSALAAWVAERGGFLAEFLEVREGSRGRGVFAKQPVTKGSLLGRVPFSLAVGATSGPECLTELCAKGKCTNLLAVALLVLHETRVAEHRLPYFEFLASSSPPRVPFLWSAEELAQLAGSSLLAVQHDDASAVKAAVEAAEEAAKLSFEQDVRPTMTALGAEYMPAASCTREAFAAALSWVVSRGLQGVVSYEMGGPCFWPCLSAAGPTSSAAGPFLLPLFDLINHSSLESDRCTTLARGDDEFFEIHARRDLAAGEEVLWSYGAHGTSELLRTYGFVEALANPNTSLMWSPADVASAVLAGIAKSGRPARDRESIQPRLDALKKLDRLPAVFVVRAGDAEDVKLPEPLLTAIQVMVMPDEEFAAWQEAGGIALGEAYLDEGCLEPVTYSFLSLVSATLQRYPDVVGRGAAAGAGSQGSGTSAACDALKHEERQLLLALERAILSLAVAEEAGEGEGEEEELTDEEEEMDEEDDEEGACLAQVMKGLKRKANA